MVLGGDGGVLVVMMAVAAGGGGVEPVERLVGGSCCSGDGGMLKEPIELMRRTEAVLERFQVAFFLSPLGSPVLEPDLEERRSASEILRNIECLKQLPFKRHKACTGDNAGCCWDARPKISHRGMDYEIKAIGFQLIDRCQIDRFIMLIDR